MSNKLKSAMERYRKSNGFSCIRFDECGDALNELADAYMREHPDDDEQEITEEWLRSVGFEPVPSDMGPNYSDHYEIDDLNLWDFNGEYWLINGLDRHPLRTRRAIRNLTDALGIALREGGGK